MSELKKPAARDRCDELEIEYTSKTSVTELRDLIAAKEAELAAAEAPAEAPEEAPAVEETPEDEEVEPTEDDDIEENLPTKIEGQKILSVAKEGNYVLVKTATCGYKLLEKEYKAL